MPIKYSLTNLLLATAIVALGLTGYQYLFPPTPYKLPIHGSSGTGYFHAFGREFELEVTEDALATTPAWNARHGNPPLSAREAMVAADKLRLRLIKAKELPPDRKNSRWVLVSANLIAVTSQRCYWEVGFEYVDMSGGSGPPNELYVPVLMDGKVIMPKKHRSDEGW